MSNYLLELGVIHLVLVLGYWLLLRRERQYHKMRLYLLGSSLLSLLIPLLKLPKLLSLPYFGPEETLVEVGMLQPTAVHAMPRVAEDPSFWDPQYLIWLYAIISGALLLRFLFNIYEVFALERQSRYEKFGDLYIRKAHHVKGSFTFFNWIFLNENMNRSQDDYHVILKHEKAHVALGHTYDLLFLELFKVCFWWVPTIWFIHKEIKKIHEYQADAHALQTYHIDQYSSILISSTLANHGLSLASSFHDGFIFKRLSAMKQKAKNVSPWKLGTLMALGIVLVIAFACSEEIDQDIQQIGSRSSNVTFEQLPAAMQADLAAIKDDLSFILVQLPKEENEDLFKIKELQELDPDLIHVIHVNQEKQVFIALRNEGANFDLLSQKSKQEGDVFTIVEEQPEYEQGMPNFYKQIAKEIRYPKAARQNDIEGTVHLQFVVEKDGSVNEIEVLKGIGYGCDEEAIRAVQQIGTFKPGKQRGKTVRVRMTMPIIFKFIEDNASVILEEIQTDQQKLTVDAKFNDGTWSGTVRDDSGELLPGTNIIVAGTNRGVVSDFDGSFTLAASASEELHVSFVGYESLKLHAD